MESTNLNNPKEKQKRKKRPHTKRASQKEPETSTSTSNSYCLNPKYKHKKSRLKYPRYPEQSQLSNTSSEQNDLPGFYYDSVKKRYFKILENSTISNAITKATISQEKSEKKRLLDLKLLEESKCKQSLSDLTNLLFKSREGAIDHMCLKNSLLRNHASNLKLTDSFPVFDNPVHGHERVEHMLKMIASPNDDKLLCLWSMKETIMQRLQLVQINEKKRNTDRKPLSIQLEPGGTTVLQSWSKITNVCWAPFLNFPERRNILYTTNCHSTGQALAFIRNLDATSQSDLVFFDFNIGKQATWTCAWNQDTEKFSVGAEKICLLIDVETRRLWELNTLNSDPLAQVFSSTNLLYNGTKKGQIIAHDLRSSSTRPVRCLSHRSSISHLLLSYNNYYLYASDYTGQLKVWDTRKNCVVMQYGGLVNEYKRIPFFIDESNTLIYGAGQDGYSRIWCLKSGKLLLNLPPPCSTSLDTIPALQFSTRWANRPGNSGLLMGLGDKLYLYSC